MWLIIEEGEASFAGMSLRLPENEEFIIGRSSECSLVLPFKSVSSTHLVLIAKGKSVLFKCGRPKVKLQVNGVAKSSGRLSAKDSFVIVGITFFLSELPPFPQEKHSSRGQRIESSGHIEGLRHLIERLAPSHDSHRIVKELLSGVLTFLGAQRGFVLLKEGAKCKEMKPIAVHEFDEKSEVLALSSFVCKKVIDTQECLVIGNTACKDKAIHSPSLAKMSPRTIICFPLKNEQNVIGVLYLDMPTRKESLSEEHMAWSKTLVNYTASLLAKKSVMTSLLQERERLLGLNRVYLQEQRFIIDESSSTKELQAAVLAAAPQEVTVLLTGETGTGKEMVARWLHSESNRKEGPFVPVNCASLPADLAEAELFGYEKGAFTGATERRMGRFELANNGTIFLDEIGELPLNIQVSLLRLLEERSVTRLGGKGQVDLDLRVICATNRNLKEAVNEGTFRSDFYYRINVFPINLKPLRERTDAIESFAKHFLQHFCNKMGKRISKISAEALALLKSHTWPGNIRELRNALEYAILSEDKSELSATSLPIGHATKPCSPLDTLSETEDNLWLSLPAKYEEAKATFEEFFLRRALKAAENDIQLAAQKCGMTRYSIYRRLKKYRLTVEEEK